MQNLDLSKLGPLELLSYEIVLRNYNRYAIRECILETGFNSMSGYVYIALENGVQIVSNFGQDVEFIIYNYETENEYYFDTYDEALNSLNT
jgi:hypothetical protein